MSFATRICFLFSTFHKPTDHILPHFQSFDDLFTEPSLKSNGQLVKYLLHGLFSHPTLVVFTCCHWTWNSEIPQESTSYSIPPGVTKDRPEDKSTYVTSRIIIVQAFGTVATFALQTYQHGRVFSFRSHTSDRPILF